MFFVTPLELKQGVHLHMTIFSNGCTSSVRPQKLEPMIQNPPKRYPLSFHWEGIQSNKQTWPRILCNRNGAISHLQTEMGFFEDFRYHRGQNSKQINITKYVSKFVICGAKMLDKCVKSQKKIFVHCPFLQSQAK